MRGELRSLDLLSSTHGSAYMVPEGQAGAGIWNSPAISPDGSKIVVVTGEDFAGYNGPLNRAIVVLNAHTLQVLGSDQEGDPNLDEDWSTTPAIFHDSTGRVMVGASNKNGVFYAYDLNNVSAGPVWSWATGLMIAMPPAYDPTLGAGGTLIFMLGGRLHGMDPANGRERWVSEFIGQTTNNLAIANGLIYVNSLGIMRIVNEADGLIVRTITPPLHGSTIAGPAVSNGYVSGPPDLLNAWHIGAPPAPTSSPTYGPSPTPTSSPTTGATPQPPPCPGEYLHRRLPHRLFLQSL